MANSALFPPWTDTLLRGALLAGAGAIVGIPAALMVWVRTPWNANMSEPLDQPVEFDHRHHVNDDGIDCLYCHYAAERSPYAGVPAADLCMNCHAQVWI